MISCSLPRQGDLLAHEMSRQSGKPYLRPQGCQLYMPDPVVVEDQSITTAGKQQLVIDRKELKKMNVASGVLVVDDVISTGGSLKALDAGRKRPSALSWVRPCSGRGRCF